MLLITRVPACTLVIFFPLGGNRIKVWDALGTSRNLYSLSNHQKTITSLCFDKKHTRLLSGSLDQQVKVYDVSDFKVVHSIKYSAPILSVALSVMYTHPPLFASSFLLFCPPPGWWWWGVGWGGAVLCCGAVCCGVWCGVLHGAVLCALLYGADVLHCTASICCGIGILFLLPDAHMPSRRPF